MLIFAEKNKEFEGVSSALLCRSSLEEGGGSTDVKKWASSDLLATGSLSRTTSLYPSLPPLPPFLTLLPSPSLQMACSTMNSNNQEFRLTLILFFKSFSPLFILRLCTKKRWPLFFYIITVSIPYL
jgi:hypothetical protein